MSVSYSLSMVSKHVEVFKIWRERDLKFDSSVNMAVDKSVIELGKELDYRHYVSNVTSMYSFIQVQFITLCKETTITLS